MATSREVQSLQDESPPYTTTVRLEEAESCSSRGVIMEVVNVRSNFQYRG